MADVSQLLKNVSRQKLQQVRWLELCAPRSLSLGNNPVEEVSSLANLYALEELLLFKTLVTNVSPIEALAKLIWLELYNTPIEETTALENLLQLTWLDLRGTHMRDRTCPVQPESVCLLSSKASVGQMEHLLKIPSTL
ncbi:MAG: hypothetical protein WA919_29890 [Coleofasciculaceae cyanobacterium]